MKYLERLKWFFFNFRFFLEMLREILRKSEWVLVGGKWTRVSVGFKALAVFN